MTLTRNTQIDLVVRRVIHATAETLFAAWTEPQRLKAWWGPRNVKCIAAEIALEVGGQYRIANEFPDGNVLWIAGEFELIDPPRKLIYTWRLEAHPGDAERVTVRFEPRDDATEVVVVHERIADAITRERHRQGWEGCLDGLSSHVSVG